MRLLNGGEKLQCGSGDVFEAATLVSLLVLLLLLLLLLLRQLRLLLSVATTTAGLDCILFLLLLLPALRTCGGGVKVPPTHASQVVENNGEAFGPLHISSALLNSVLLRNGYRRVQVEEKEGMIEGTSYSEAKKVVHASEGYVLMGLVWALNLSYQLV